MSMCNLLFITRVEYVLNGSKMVRTTSKLPIIIKFHALVANPVMKTTLNGEGTGDNPQITQITQMK